MVLVLVVIVLGVMMVVMVIALMVMVDIVMVVVVMVGGMMPMLHTFQPSDHAPSFPSCLHKVPYCWHMVCVHVDWMTMYPDIFSLTLKCTKLLKS